jgi:predicted enzyme related to lactoylglutathione lyase
MTTQGIQTVIYPVHDLARAKAAFAALLGAEPVADSAYYVGFQVGAQHIGLNPNGHASGMTGPVAYYHVDDINKAQAALVAAGGKEGEAVHEVGNGRLIASVVDADGNVIGLLQDTQ